MNAFLSITDNGTINLASDKLEAIAEDRLMAWVRWSLGEESDEFVEFVKDNYLSGGSAVLKPITGETRGHVAAWMQKKLKGKRKSVFVIRPGVGIDGMQNYLEKWVGTKYEFMRPAFEAFGAETRIADAVDKNISKMIGKVNREE